MSLSEKSKATRQKLSAVATEVFVNKGFQAAGVREICTTAGASPAGCHLSLLAAKWNSTGRFIPRL